LSDLLYSYVDSGCQICCIAMWTVVVRSVV